MKFEIKTVSEANAREHWRTKHKRKKQQQSDFNILWKSFKPKVTLPAVITFTRFSCKLMDSDNLAGSFKHTRDQLAREIGVDDGDGSVTWIYKQERILKRDHYFTVTIDEEILGNNE